MVICAPSAMAHCVLSVRHSFPRGSIGWANHYGDQSTHNVSEPAIHVLPKVLLASTVCATVDSRSALYEHVILRFTPARPYF